MPTNSHPDTEPYLRHASHYLSVALTANDLCEKGGDVRDGVALFAKEWPNFMCAWEWAAKRINEQEEATRVCIDYMRNTRNLVSVAKRPHMMVPLCTAALNAAILLKDRINESLALSLLGEAHNLLSQHAEAEAAHRRCLAICEDIHDPFAPNIASSLCNVAAYYVTKGRYHEAETLYRRSLAICEKTLGGSDWKTGLCLMSLASLRIRQELHSEAEPLLLRALSIIEDAVGGDHPRTAGVLHELASCYTKQGRHAEAEPLLRRSLSILEKVLGQDHSDTAQALSLLAEVRDSLGSHSEAEVLHIRALTIYENNGEESKNTARTLEELGVLYYNQYRYEEADSLYRRSLAIVERVFGRDHVTSLEVVFNLAILYMEQGKSSEAEALFRRAIVGFEKALGPGDPHTLQAKQGYSHFQRRFGRVENLQRHGMDTYGV